MTRIVASLALGLSITVSASAAEWGTLTGRFVYDGTPPAAKALVVNAAGAACGANLLDESLVVDPQGGVQNVVITLRAASGKSLDVHPAYEQTAAAEVELDNRNCRFEPHVVLLRTSQTLLLKNSDALGHNCNGNCFVNDSFNVLLPPNSTTPKVLDKVERMAVKVNCNIHPWMSGYLVVNDHPYMAVSAADGAFEIKNVPVGKHDFHFWQEKLGYLKNVAVAGEKTDRKGVIELEIKPGANDLGAIKIK